jgi:hypothetical protein
MTFDGVAERQIGLDLIVAATSHTMAHEVAICDQAADDALSRAFRDSHDLSDIA